MKLISKRNLIISMVMFLLFITVASVSAVDVINQGDIAAETQSSSDDVSILTQEVEIDSVDDSIDSANSEEILSAVTVEPAETQDILGTSYEHPDETMIDMFEPDKNYSDNHHFTLLDEHGVSHTPQADALEFLSHFREISGGFAYRANPNHPIDLYWTAVEDGTMYLILNGWETEFKDLHGKLFIGDEEIPATDDYIDVVRRNGEEYQWICVEKFTGIAATTANAAFETNRNHGPPIKIPGVITVANSTNITLWVNDKFEDTIYLGDSATLHAIVTHFPEISEIITNGIVYYNNSAVNDLDIIYHTGTSEPGGSIIFTPGELGTYYFKAWYPEYLNSTTGEHNFESHSNIVILHVIERPPSVNFTVNKTWNDSDDQDGLRQKNVTVALLADDNEVNQTNLNEANGWTYTFENLPTRNENGELITYTVKELDLSDYYTATYSYKDNYNCTITNTHIAEVTNVTVNKKWNDSDNQDGVRPESVTIELFANGEYVGQIILSEANDWTYTFENLDVNDQGKAIKYTIQENDLSPEYIVTYTNNTAYNLTAINTHKAEVTNKTVTKVWNDSDDQDGQRPESVSITLKGSDGNNYTATITEIDGTWTYTFENLPVYYNHGTEIEYTVQETVPANYTETYNQDNLTITNTHTPEVTNKTVTKVWNDSDDQD
ncbi:Cna B-type domain-containing protein, partial [uncultured Methanobrevibacter sp.]|uniref:Cna B-type domain-containing protein n=1 Tax=uncultured Methanobrevibacter sp. TaxID=253161 RepID=UPI00260D64BC